MANSPLPSKTRQWQVKDLTSGFDALKLEESAPIPELGERDCLVKIEATSLNYRDLVIPKVSGDNI